MPGRPICLRVDCEVEGEAARIAQPVVRSQNRTTGHAEAR